MPAEIESSNEGRVLGLRFLSPWLLLALALSVAAMVLGAGRGDKVTPALAAAFFACAVLAAAVWLNVPLWARDPSLPGERTAFAGAMRRNVWLAALVYGWAALALFAIYSLSELEWFHANQYASAAALFALGLSAYAVHLGRKRDQMLVPLYLTVLHGLAAVAGLIYLFAIGKLATPKADWVANDVFLAGGFMIVALCAIAAVTQMRLRASPTG